MTTPAVPDPTPHEPEIEALGKIAHGGLWVARRVFWLAGSVATGYGLWRSAADAMWLAGAPDAVATAPAATGVPWLCVGLPLLAPVDWLFGRGRWLALGIGAGLWFGASWLPKDQEYGFVLRMFASLIACLSLLVWRTLWRLTKSAPPRS